MTKRLFVAAALVAATSAAPTFAEGFQLGLGAGAAWPTGDLSDGYEQHFSLDLWLAGPIAGHVSWRG